MARLCRVEPQISLQGLCSFFTREYAKDFVFYGEAHDFHEVVCVLDGSMSITAGTDVYTLSAGNAIIHPPMEFHAIRAAEGTAPTALIFSFKADTFPELTKKIFAFTAADEALLVSAQHNVITAFDCQSISGGYRLLKSIKHGYETAAQRAITELTLFLLRLLTDRSDVLQHHISASAQNYSSIADYISKNLPELQCVEQVAAKFGMSNITLQKLFHKYTGSGVMHYINHLKITQAIEMLRQGYPSKEVALSLGFANQNYFSTVFKRIAGLPPTQYMKKH